MATKEEGPRSLARFLESIGEGDFHADASEKFFELNNSLQDHALRTDSRVKGKMTMVFDVSIDQRGVVGVTIDTTIKKPKLKRAPAQAWVTKSGNLVTEHPRQTTLPLREVGGREVKSDNDDEDVRRPTAREV